MSPGPSQARPPAPLATPRPSPPRPVPRPQLTGVMLPQPMQALGRVHAHVVLGVDDLPVQGQGGPAARREAQQVGGFGGRAAQAKEAAQRHDGHVLPSSAPAGARAGQELPKSTASRTQEAQAGLGEPGTPTPRPTPPGLLLAGVQLPPVTSDLKKQPQKGPAQSPEAAARGRRVWVSGRALRGSRQPHAPPAQPVHESRGPGVAVSGSSQCRLCPAE